MQWKSVLLVALPSCVLAQNTFQGPAQAARGHELFVKTAKPQACVTCHALGGEGTAVAPDLKMWSRLPPRAAAMAITSTVTEKVVTVEPKQGPAFPGIKISDDANTVKYYDVSVEPPAIREFPKAEAPPVSPNAKWKHPPSREKYSLEQLADLVSFIRWAGAKDGKAIKPEDVE
jgi:mono/diheme cytochrome c family protein